MFEHKASYNKEKNRNTDLLLKPDPLKELSKHKCWPFEKFK